MKIFLIILAIYRADDSNEFSMSNHFNSKELGTDIKIQKSLKEKKMDPLINIPNAFDKE